MIINIKNKNDLITLDLRIKQIRYLKNYLNMGEIEFINLSNDDISAYDYLFKMDRYRFLRALKEDIKSFAGIDIKIKNCEVLIGGENEN